MMVTLLTSTGDGVLDTRRMPRADTSDLSETLVGLAWKLLGVPSAGYSLESVTLGYSDGVNHLVLSEHLVDENLLL